MGMHIERAGRDRRRNAAPSPSDARPRKRPCDGDGIGRKVEDPLAGGAAMDHDELKQWLNETSLLLDGMDGELAGGVQEWGTFRETFKQAGETAAALHAVAVAALEKLASAYRS